MLYNFYKILFIRLLEPFQQIRRINKYKRRLKMDTAIANSNGKIYFFINQDVELIVVQDTKQQLSLLIKQQSHSQSFFVRLVYAKCNVEERRAIWEDIYQLASGMNIPWFIGGDFSVVLDAEEKIGGLPINHANFKNCIKACDLSEVHCKGSPFT